MKHTQFASSAIMPSLHPVSGWTAGEMGPHVFQIHPCSHAIALSTKHIHHRRGDDLSAPVSNGVFSEVAIETGAD